MTFAGFVRELEAQRPDGRNLLALARVGSTNDLARRIARECLADCERLDPALVVAYEQTAGRGRRGHRWESPPGRGVYATLLLPAADPATAHTLPLLAAVGICRALDRFLAAPRCRLAWPNDLMVGERKIGGLLIETLSAAGEMTAVIGFGVNHSAGEAGPAAPGATSVAQQTAAPPSLGELFWGLAAGLDAELEHAGDAARAIAAYESLSVHRPGERLRCRTGEGEVAGTFLGFDGRGFLRLATAAGERVLAAGELASPDDPGAPAAARDGAPGPAIGKETR